MGALPAYEDLLGELAPPGPGVLEPVPYAFGSPATGGLYRLHGDGWSWFCKVLQHVRHWPLLATMPPPMAEEFRQMFPWREELELWDPVWTATLPEGLRVPELHGIVDLGDDRVAVWMEDVRQAPPSCDLAQYDRSARLLGRWNARCAAPSLVGRNPHPPNFGLHKYAQNAVPFRGLGPLEDDDLWAHPWLADSADLREDLRGLGRELPAMLDRLDRHRLCIPHGDASPQNLLVPAEDPDTFVVIDLSFRAPHALGFDLGQLLVGLTHAGQVPAAMLPEIAARIVPAYLDGLAAEGVTRRDDEVRDAFATSVMIRSGFDGLPLDTIGSDEPGARHAFDERLAMTRFLVDHYLASQEGR
ncbi:hypothetical protein GCM10009623_19390 [Nocardioides aestuarii]|uniref:Aminoglycoside phosphotransferase n=1 Tax=Nocardioides aestuarii TaxID=252231 RepID=A0ABW4TMA5_9ACTN